MKILAITLLSSLTFLSFQSPIVSEVKSVIVADNAPVVEWKKETIDAGDIPQGKPYTMEFNFVNNGKKDILITEVKAACGCTATDYTKTPIKPGQTAYVKATYNAANKGTFAKTVTVTTNSGEAAKVLTLKGKVI